MDEHVSLRFNSPFREYEGCEETSPFKTSTSISLGAPSSPLLRLLWHQSPQPACWTCAKHRLQTDGWVGAGQEVISGVQGRQVRWKRCTTCHLIKSRQAMNCSEAEAEAKGYNCKGRKSKLVLWAAHCSLC